VQHVVCGLRTGLWRLGPLAGPSATAHIAFANSTAPLMLIYSKRPICQWMAWTSARAARVPCVRRVRL